MRWASFKVCLSAFCALLLIAPAVAQKTKAQLNTEVGTTFPDQNSGQITPSGVRAFQNDVINSTMPTAPVTNNNFASFDGATGLLKDSGISSSSQFVANANIIPGPANTFKGSIDGVETSDIALTACTLTYQITKWVSGTGWQCGLNPVLPSRAIAATLNLSAFNAVTTQGYASPGDGGGATFYKRSTAVTSFTISQPGTCTNGTWPGVKFTGGSGTSVIATVVCSGGVVTSVTLSGIGGQGNGYTVGNVLTASCVNIGGCGTIPQITVTGVGNGTLVDAFTATFSTVNAGSGCTNGTYYGITASGGVGDRLRGVVVISGNTLSSFTQSTPGGGYKVGDQLTLTGITGCVTSPIIQVVTNTATLASFTDNNGAGNAWQYSPTSGAGVVNALQFGMVADFVSGTDQDATDSGPALRAALQYANIGSRSSDAAGGWSGGTVLIPQGSYLVCGGVVVYNQTTLAGVNFGATSIKQCNSDSAATNFVTLGDPNSHVGNFENRVRDITLFGGFGSGSAYMVYSNNSQSGDSIVRVAMLGVSRGCVKYEIGYGGQSEFGIHSSWCVPNPTYFTSGGPSFDLSGNFGFVIDGQSHISGASAGGAGVRFGDGGTNFVNGLHCEGAVTNCVAINGSGSSPPMTTIIGALGPATNLIYIETGTPANFTTVINARPSGATCTVYMQATASCAKTGNQLGLATY
ncbi:autotransporter outer membrane beta-barrel domain-containing protein [Bradyrhizobium sp. 195]|uniref:hypothetical protein n=1 Tax=Bradyrhizobium sp. 195 TaxID=2782662 RepID=UPI002001191F|nr:hypothetical protein [Bradyrhizobium sp. 195]UPK28390.1 hypothetical protein IVB26_08225 [Bradyrhizobium sp. 195]